MPRSAVAIGPRPDVGITALGLNSAALLVGSSGFFWAVGPIHDGAASAPIRLRPLWPGGSIKGAMG